MFDCRGARRRKRRAEHSRANRTHILSSLLGDSVALEEPLAWQRAPDLLAWDPLLPLVLAQVDTHRGKMVEVLSRRVLAWHSWRVSDLLPLIEAVVHRVSHGGTVLVLVHGAGRAQRPWQRLGVQPLSGSLQGAGGDAGEIPKGSPPPSPIAQLGAVPPTGDEGLGPGLQPPVPPPKKGFFPIPTCLCCFSSFFSFSFSSFSLWQSSLEARSWEQGGLVQSPSCHPPCTWGKGCCNALQECLHRFPSSDPQEGQKEEKSERRCSGRDKQQQNHHSGLSVPPLPLLQDGHRGCDTGDEHL